MKITMSIYRNKAHEGEYVSALSWFTPLCSTMIIQMYLPSYFITVCALVA